MVHVYGETAMASADPDGRPSMLDLKQHFDTSQDQRWRGYTIPRKDGPRKSWMWCQRGNCTSRGLAYNKFVGGRVRASACVHVGGCVCARGRVRAWVGVRLQLVNGCSHVRTGVRGVWFCASARHACAAGCVFRERPCVCCRRTLMSLSWSSSVCAAGGGWTARRGCGRRGRIRPHG